MDADREAARSAAPALSGPAPGAHLDDIAWRHDRRAAPDRRGPRHRAAGRAVTGERSRRVRQVSAAGLAVVVLALAALSIAGVVRTRRAADTVTRSTTLAAAYERAHDAAAEEELAEQHYRLEPGPPVREAHAAAAIALRGALAGIERLGNAGDRAVAGRVRALHEEYLAAMNSLFAAVDAGDGPLAERIDDTLTDPVFGRLSDELRAANTAHADAAARAVADLRHIEAIVFTTTTLGSGAGLVLIAAFALVAAGYQRRLLRQAAAGEHQAMHDALTGLPNRVLFARRVETALGDPDAPVSLLMLDLDRFKEVNDTLGHQCGDELLRQVAARCTAALRAGDVVARLSGDEFAVLLPGTRTAEAAMLAAALQQRLHQSFALGEVIVDVEASIGVAGAPDDDRATHASWAAARSAGAGFHTPDALLRCADIAMHAAKEAKNGVAVYRPSMHTDDSSRLLLLGDLRRALDAGDQLTLHYQPKIRLDDQGLSGVEALIRWAHPTRGAIPPAEFIPVAETTGLINRLTLYVLRLALAQERAWLDAGLPIPVAVNLSPRCLLDAELVRHITDLLAEFAIPAALLRLEVTESAVMANPAQATATLTELHDLGIHLSIDDYGTGYSSMAYLKALPVDELKVDRTFVQHMDVDQDDAVLVRGAIELGHNLGMTVVAEGVEGAAHAVALQALGCDIAQGYHYARPMPGEDVTAWLRTYTAATAIRESAL
ncbi:bifunctional diguanylate cyclase/phosphodiesterase [Dactylosporangium vinaceum]|uniref:Bifunctional diguanylate cyclase/phosphodiesterase n=1 Tax=Dactylosporangium vinaceum TaxID=53362 RepID=A0ABV5M9T7_9ACTN|nr:bifunctional diguanylate cyclase/phosphodiesterase [Dactylosporangium vinaceum]UAB93171.1 bifunctional diguanylate cyclase/phosphodiesterase [Dactylosporangium vinaceum]